MQLRLDLIINIVDGDAKWPDVPGFIATDHKHANTVCRTLE